MFFPRLVIAGTQSGVGKTTLSLAVMTALAKRGLLVQPFKIGPDYIDPSFHLRASGLDSCNLDAWLVPEDGLRGLFTKRAPAEIPALMSGNGTSGISIIEGVMGLYDGFGSSVRASTAHVASILKAPVVLVINARGMSLSAAAMISGYVDFAAGHNLADRSPSVDISHLQVAGVILNHVSGDRHYALLRDCIESNTGIPCLGFIRKGAVPRLPDRHLGLVPATELEGLEPFFESLAELAEDSLDLSGLINLARNAPELDMPPCEAGGGQRSEPAASLAIGVPRDEAFSFYYPENLELLESLGATLVYFSPLRDSFLPPNLHGLYLGGGFPEVFAGTLEANASFRTSLATALEQGMPAYAECGGMLYLCSQLRIGTAVAGPRSRNQKEFAMAGFFPEHAKVTNHLQPFGYVTVTLLRDCLLGKAGTSYRAHEFHYSRIVERTSDPLFRVEKEDGRSWTGGLARKNVVAGFPHLHFYGCPELAEAFLTACRVCKASAGVTG